MLRPGVTALLVALPLAGDPDPGRIARLAPVTEFSLVPIGGGPARPAWADALEAALRARYPSFGFRVTVPLEAQEPPLSCAALLAKVAPPRGTLYLVDGRGRCSRSRLAWVDRAAQAGVVPLRALGTAGPEKREERLRAVSASVVAELLGLPFACDAAGTGCCPLSRATSPRDIDRRAKAACPAHGPALDALSAERGMR